MSIFEKKPILSVIMPSFNVASYIEECLESVLSQSFKEIEILCIDAGSKDGTREIIEKAAIKDARVRLIDSPVRSYGFQVNMGIREAQGDYVAIVETDDRLLSEMFETLMDYALRYRTDYVKSDYYLLKEIEMGEELFCEKSVLTRLSFLYGQVVNPVIYPGLHAECSYIWNGIYRKDFLEEKGLWLNETYGAAYQDIGFFHKMICRADRAVYVKKPLYLYRLGHAGASTSSGKGLFYSREEYASLFEGGLSKYEIRFHGNMIDRKMAIASVCWESDKLLRNNGYNAVEIEKSDDYQWFRNCLKKEREEGRFCQAFFSEREWKDVNKLIDDLTEYAKQIAYEDHIREEKMMHCVPEGNGVVIVGCGRYGRECYDNFFNKDIYIKGFADNDKSKWGSNVCFKKVFSLEEGVKRYPDSGYVIAVKDWHTEIKQQLMEYGIESEMITFFEP